MPRKTQFRLRGRRAAEAASMRPRPDAAENPWFRPRTAGQSTGFNEAAARCRGKPTDTASLLPVNVVLQ